MAANPCELVKGSPVPSNASLSPTHAIRASHERSHDFGLCIGDTPDFGRVSRQDLRRALDENGRLSVQALPVMETLFHQIHSTHSMVILTDAQGLILQAFGDNDFLERADQVALRPGVDWSERSKGTNAIGTALFRGEPTVVHADQHFLQVNHFLTCSCAPIHDPMGSIVAALDVTGEQHSYHQHTMALVRMSAQMIENRLFNETFAGAVRIHFHMRPEFIGTLAEGIAAFTTEGKFLSANRSGLMQLGLPLAALRTHNFSSLFGLPISMVLDHLRRLRPGPIPSYLRNGVAVHIRAECSLPLVVAPGLPQRPVASLRCARPALTTDQPPRGLRVLETGDEQVSHVLGKLRKVIGREVPVLITGETGTGKEWLARAIHEESPRRDGAFVAINCAAIPENLIESELFGYAEGAFTGGRKRGSGGRILAANGGTLFLDEIGDMPLALQARLLRVVQERVVTPLGAERHIPVDFALVCATHRDLRALIDGQGFREDLYYRINGLAVKLPALRHRTDLRALVASMLAEGESDQETPWSVDDEVMALFRAYPWPGNLRQLAAVLRTARLMLDGETRLRHEHLPDDFLEDVQRRGRVAAAPCGVGYPVDGDAACRDLDELTQRAIQEALRRFEGNVSAAARALGVSRNTVYRRLSGLSQPMVERGAS